LFQKQIKTQITMKSTKEVMNDYVKIQKEMVDSLMESTKKVQESMGKADVAEKTMEVYNDWLAKQQTIAEDLSTTVKSQSSLEKAPKFVQEMLDAQESFAKSWFEAFRAAVKSKTPKELTDMVSANVQKVQENFTSIYEESKSQVGKEVKAPTTEDMTAGFKKMIDMWTPVYKLN